MSVLVLTRYLWLERFWQQCSHAGGAGSTSTIGPHQLCRDSYSCVSFALSYMARLGGVRSVTPTMHVRTGLMQLAHANGSIVCGNAVSGAEPRRGSKASIVQQNESHT